ncbi:cobalamin biosynthesis protein CbiX [Wenjunlia vitaminophila]|uniref:Cobalamin biosynthesis protein CbiX n=1 Tax=Wenjunlia vitaminophila TaxID=76728 RepID=A0A0T6LTF3_WENVI|nr:sirohydrochlorin chelatase [Wenjunlia vitaminophila]KRV49288.1 cobalamin biosynthesis protein CbiX [Wenjunlia vitaminophila]
MTPPDQHSAPALLLVSPGGRDERGAEAFRSLVAGLGERHPELPIGGGFVGTSSPPLADAVASLVGRGVRSFAVVPLTLSPTGPETAQIPSALAAEERRHPGTSYVLGRPLGPDPALLGALERRIEEVLGGRRSPMDRARTTVLLVGRGSTDPYANAEAHRAARLLWEGRGLAGVETAFVSLAAPDVPAGLDRCRTLGARRVVVLPYLLFPGVLPDKVAAQAQGWADVHPEVAVDLADVLAGGDDLFELVLERYREAVHGGARTDWPGGTWTVGPLGGGGRVAVPARGPRGR